MDVRYHVVCSLKRNSLRTSRYIQLEIYFILSAPFMPQVDHELSVPAVSGILLSAACWGVVEVSAVLLASSTGSDADFMQSAEKLTGGLQQLVLKSTSAAITLVLQQMVRPTPLFVRFAKTDDVL